MSERFFVSPPITGQQALLTGDEARHLTAVMRASVGDQIVLFDGSGAEFTGRITAIRKQGVELTIESRREFSRELPLSLTLAVALPKGDRQKWLAEKATEIGVSRLIPLITERGVAQPVESALERLRRAVIEASKQCGRNSLLEIGSPLDAAAFFKSTPQSATRLLADLSGQPLSAVAISLDSPVSVAIGPEGGFAPAEIAAATAAGWQPISLGSRILRVETAALAIAAWAAFQR